MALTLDGHNSDKWSGSNSGGVALTTTQAKDLIVVAVINEHKGTGYQTVTGVSGTGTTGWTKRSTKNTNTGYYLTVDIWSGTAAAALSNVTITATLDGATDDAVIIAWGVNYDGVTVPQWDTNGSLPATNVGVAGSAPSVAGISTTSTAPFIFAVEGNGVGPTTENVGLIGGVTPSLFEGGSNNGGTYAVNGLMEAVIFASQQSSISASFGTSVASGVWVIIADAIMPPAAGGAALDEEGLTHQFVTRW